MTEKILLVPMLAALALAPACSGKDLLIAQRYEGIKDDTLRVCLREQSLENATEKEVADQKAKIIEASKKRAALILIGHIRVTYPQLSNGPAVEKKIVEALEKGRIFSMTCEDEYCDILVDFPVKDIITETEKWSGKGTAQ